MEKLFTSPQGREILIKIDTDAIFFYHNRDIQHQKQWVEQQEQLGNEITEEDKKTYEFYWIGVDEWKKDLNNWHNHMLQKNWFTNEMYDFLLDKSIC